MSEYICFSGVSEKFPVHLEIAQRRLGICIMVKFSELINSKTQILHYCFHVISTDQFSGMSQTPEYSSSRITFSLSIPSITALRTA